MGTRATLRLKWTDREADYVIPSKAGFQNNADLHAFISMAPIARRSIKRKNDFAVSAPDFVAWSLFPLYWLCSLVGYVTPSNGQSYLLRSSCPLLHSLLIAASFPLSEYEHELDEIYINFPPVMYSFIHLVVCLTTGPKSLANRALRIVRSRASSFKCEYPLLSLRSSSSFLRFLPRLPVTSIPPFNNIVKKIFLRWLESKFSQEIILILPKRKNG